MYNKMKKISFLTIAAMAAVLVSCGGKSGGRPNFGDNEYPVQTSNRNVEQVS